MFYFINSQVSNQKTPFNTTFFDYFRNSKIDVPKSAIRNFYEIFERITIWKMLLTRVRLTGTPSRKQTWKFLRFWIWMQKAVGLKLPKLRWNVIDNWKIEIWKIRIFWIDKSLEISSLWWNYRFWSRVKSEFRLF